MKMPEMTLRLGDVFLTLRGLLPSEDDGYLCRFRTEKKRTDVLCTVTRDDTLQPPKEPPRVREVWKEVWTAEGRHVLCYYSDLRHEKCYAMLTECAEDRLSLCFNGLLAHDLGRTLLTCIAMEHLLLRRGEAIFHAAWIERNGKALLFSGASGAGKSTHTAQWESLRHTPVCNGDKALLFLRGGTLWAGGLPYAGSSGICTDRRLPVHAVVFLSHGEKNVLTRLGVAEAVRLLVSQMPVQRWNEGDVSAALKLAVKAAETVPVYTYACLPDASAVAYLDGLI